MIETVGQMSAMFLGLVICGYVAARMAVHRGRSVKAWIWLGVLIGPIAWLALLMAGRVRAGKPIFPG